MNALTPNEMVACAEKAAIGKTNHGIKKLLFLSILGGIYISIGSALATTAAAGTLGVLPYGLVKLLMGLVFSLGLILIVLGGAELFTSSTLSCIARLNKEIKTRSLAKIWSIVYLGNFIGSIITAFLMFLSKQYTFGNGSVGVAAFGIANSKMHLDFSQAIVLGVFCNILVCLAIWLTFSARGAADKILAIIFPITAFVAMGFEHSIANMFMIPVALFIKHFDFNFILSHNIDVANLTWHKFLVRNLIPVTIGNIIGGLFVWFSYWNIYSNKKADEN